MKEVVQRLLDSKTSAYAISKETEVYSSVIKRLRSGQQSIEESKFNNIEKLYQYQLEKEMGVELNQDRYSQYRETVGFINNTKDYEEKFKQLKALNTNIAMAVNSILFSVGITENSTRVEDQLAYKMTSLLRLNEGVKVLSTSIKGVYEIHGKAEYICVSKMNSRENSYVSLNSVNISNDISTKTFHLDISSDKSYYKVYSSKFIDLLESVINDDTVRERNIVQQVIDRISMMKM